MRLSVVFLGLILLTSPALAASCTPAPGLSASNYPGPNLIPNGNNLLLPVGKSVAASGQSLMVAGRLLDRNCVPIAGGIIEMWQANPFGKWVLASAADIATPYPSFAGAGRAVTDNDGRFVFITAFPGPVAGRAPNLNLKVFVHGMPDFTTVLFFGGDQRNAGDSQYRQLSAANRQAITMEMGKAADGGGLVGSITLTLPAKAPYRTF